MRARIVYTRHDGGVSVCVPSARAIAAMTGGGAWGDMPHGFMATQIIRQIEAGHLERGAVRFAGAMMFGGLTEAEALDVIRERDCGHLGTGHELWDVDEIPRDRWFRNAWRRSHNGGPIDIDLTRARPIQLSHIRLALKDENTRREREFMDPAVINWGQIRDEVAAAQDIEDLRRIWPNF